MLKLEFSAADPMASLTSVQEAIRREPQRSDLRVYLFQLYCVLGEWAKAGNQLVALPELDAETRSMAQTYTEALRCEALRAEVFAGTRTPLILGDPADWLAGMIEALRLDAAGHHAQARAMREQALDAAPATSGTADGAPFAWLADADSRLGPVLELIVNGKYYWAPVERVSRVTFETPTDLRDVVWQPATVTLASGGETVALMPTRYPGSEKSPQPALQLARQTEWREITDGTYFGLGQRMFATDSDDLALLDLRELVFNAASTDA